MTAMLPAHLTETLNSLGDAARELADEVRADRAQREKTNKIALDRQRRQNRRTTILLVFVAVVVVGLLTIVVQNRSRSNENATILRQTARTSSQVVDCTTPGGDCYERGNERTEEALSRFMQLIIAVEACGGQYATESEIEACAIRRLAATEPSPSPSASPTD
jgi:hypothetical protein